MLSIALCPLLHADSLAPFQFGPTGLFVKWSGGSSADSNDGDNFVTVTAVRSGSPADGLILVNDKIYAANGTQLSTGTLQLYKALKRDPRPVLGDAITQSEAGDGKLTFDIERNGTRQDITIQLLITHTAYSATWPENCPKSDLIVANAVDFVVNKFSGDGGGSKRAFTFGSLLLLAMDDDQYLDELKVMMDSQFGTEDVTRDGSDAGQRTLWWDGLTATAAAEYYIRTGDTSVLDNLQYHADYCFEIEAGGGWGHGYPGNGYPDQGYVFGGLVNACGGQVFVSLCLARECGVEMDDADFEKTLRYFYRYASVAAPEYGDHRPGDGGGHNGKTSQVGVGVSLLNEPYHTAGRFVAAQDALNVNQFEGGHTGNFPNVLWRGISLGLVPEERSDAYRYAMDHMRWYLELCRSHDGSFQLLPAYEETRYADKDWGLMIPLYYISGRNTLRITGAPPTEHSVIKQVPEVMAKHADFSKLTHAGGYADDDFPFTLTQNVQSMGDLAVVEKAMRHWHPVVRFNAARSIGNLATNANLSALNQDSDPDNDLTDPAVDVIVAALQDADARVRTAGLMGITGLDGFWPGKLSDFKYDEDDYRRMAPYVESILNRDDICHWELDGAIWAMVVMPEDIKLANADRLFEVLGYEPNWWPRYAAMQAIRRLPANVQADYAMEMVDAYLTEEHSVPRGAFSGAVKGMISDCSPFFQNGEREAILQILGEDLAGGIHPRPYAYNQDSRYHLDGATLGALLGSYSYTEFEAISEELNVFFTRTANVAERLPRGGQLVISELVDYFEYLNYNEPEVIDNLGPLMPGIKAMSIAEVSKIYRGDNNVWTSYADDLQQFVDDVLVSHQTAYGDVPLVSSYAYQANPPQIKETMPFPDAEAQAINFKFEAGSGTSVFNHGMRGNSAVGLLSSEASWSGIGVAPGSANSLNANLGCLSAYNPEKGASDVTVSSWIRLDENLPNNDAHYVAISALGGFDLGVRRLQVDGAWKNTLFVDSSLWGNSHLPLYGLNDSNGRPEIYLKSGKDYFIMFESIQHADTEVDLTLLHLYDPETGLWLSSDGNHQNPGGERYLSGEITVGIGSLDADVLDSATRFPGLIDNAQIWTGVVPLTPSEKLTLATKGSLIDVGLQPWVQLDEPSAVDAISAQINCTIAANAPAGAKLTLYYGLSDGGEIPGAWQNSVAIQSSNGNTLLSAGEYGHLLENLLPNSAYYLRAHAQNPTGAMLEHWSPRSLVISTLSVENDNEAPAANAGLDLLVKDSDQDGFALVTLDASASADDLGIQTYTWTDDQNNTLYSGPDATANVELAVGTHRLTLTTTDYNSNSSEDQYYIYVLDDSGPTANAGPNQSLVDYNRDGARKVYLSGQAGDEAASINWILEGQSVGTTNDLQIDLPPGEHTLIYTATDADGNSNSDSVRINVLTEAEAIAAWTNLPEAAIPSSSILAAQDFSELSESVADDPLVRSYPSSEFPTNEGLDFWGFSMERTQTDETSYRLGNYGVTSDKAFEMTSNYYVFYVLFTYTSEPIPINGAINVKASMQFKRNTKWDPAKNTFADAKAICTMEDGSEQEVLIYGFDRNELREISSTIESADIPEGTVSVIIKATGLLVEPNRSYSIDNIVLTGTNVYQPTLSATPPRSIDVTTTEATLSGEIVDTGNRDPNVSFYYGLEDRGMTTEGWDHSYDIGAQDGSFSELISGLKAGQTYYYRILADNGAAQVFTDPVMRFTTKPAPPAIEATPASLVTFTSAVLNGEIISTGGDTPTVKMYFGATDQGASADGWDASFDFGLQSGAFSQNVSGLTSETAYFYRIHAVNVSGEIWSEAQSFYTANGQTFSSVKNGAWNDPSIWNGGVYPRPGDGNTWHILHTITRGATGSDFLAQTIEIGDGESKAGTLNLEPGNGTLSVGNVVLNNNGRIDQDKDINTLTGETLTFKGDGGIITPDRLSSNRRMTLNFERYVGSGTVYVYGNNDSGTPNVIFQTTNASPSNAMRAFTGTIHRDRLTGAGGAIGFNFSITDPTFAIVLGDSASDLAPTVGNGSASDTLGQNGKLHLTSGVDIAVRDLHLYDQASDGTVITDIHLPHGTYTLDTATNPDAIDVSNVDGQDYSRFFTGGTGTVTVAEASTPAGFATWMAETLSPSELQAYQINPSIDFDGDGLSLIKEYYFGKNPMRPDASQLFEYFIDTLSGRLVARYQRKRNQEGVIAIHQSSNDLVNWTTLERENEAVSTLSGEMENVEISTPSGSNHKFIRVRLETP